MFDDMYIVMLFITVDIHGAYLRTDWITRSDVEVNMWEAEHN
jgi:hypothetical protein